MEIMQRPRPAMLFSNWGLEQSPLASTAAGG
jgi:hypothetical protein